MRFKYTDETKISVNPYGSSKIIMRGSQEWASSNLNQLELDGLILPHDYYEGFGQVWGSNSLVPVYKLNAVSFCDPSGVACSLGEAHLRRLELIQAFEAEHTKWLSEEPEQPVYLGKINVYQDNYTEDDYQRDLMEWNALQPLNPEEQELTFSQWKEKEPTKPENGDLTRYHLLYEVWQLQKPYDPDTNIYQQIVDKWNAARPEAPIVVGQADKWENDYSESDYVSALNKWETEEPKDPRVYDDVLFEVLVSQAKAYRDALYYENIEVDGYVWQVGLKDLMNLNDALEFHQLAQLPDDYAISWTLADNTQLDVTAGQIKKVKLAYASRKLQIHESYVNWRTIRDYTVWEY